MILHNVTRNTILAKEPCRARTLCTRARGMIGRKFSEQCDALIFEHCNAVHSLFMSQDLDLLFVSRENRILHVRENFPPWRVCERCGSACLVIELPAGTIRKSATQTGDVIDLDVELIRDLNTPMLRIVRPAPAANLYGDEKQ